MHGTVDSKNVRRVPLKSSDFIDDQQSNSEYDKSFTYGNRQGHAHFHSNQELKLEKVVLVEYLGLVYRVLMSSPWGMDLIVAVKRGCPETLKPLSFYT